MLERKQKSMALGIRHQQEDNTLSPLLVQQKNERNTITLRGYDSLNETAHGKATKIASDLSKNVVHQLSNVDTDRMQHQFLSNRIVDANVPSHPSINLPTLPKTMQTKDSVRSDLTKSRRMPSHEQSKLRVQYIKSTRPMMHIKNGKLMLTGK
jgi:hypothetical protein